MLACGWVGPGDSEVAVYDCQRQGELGGDVTTAAGVIAACIEACLGG